MKRLLSVSLILFFCFCVYAQEPTAWQLTNQDGLPSMTVYKVIQDQEGYIWMGTARGITKYDGREFINIDLTGLIDKEIIYISEDIYGRIWFNNLSGQIGFVDNLEYQLYTPSISIYEDSPLELSGRDSVFIVSYRNSNENKKRLIKLKVIEKNEIKESLIYTNESNFPILKEFNNIWYSRDIFSQDNLFKINYISSDTVCSKSFDFLNFKNSGDNKIEYISESQTIYYSDNGWILKGQNKRKPKRIFQYTPHGLNDFVKIGKKLWIITQNGIFILDTHSDKIKKHWFKGKSINKAFLDRENNIWLCTAGSGVFIIPNLDLELYTETISNIPKTDIHSLLYDHDYRELFVGTSGAYLSRFNPRKKTFSSYKIPLSGRIMTIVKKDSNTLILGLDHGLCSFDLLTNKTTILDQKMAIKIAAVDNEDNLWLGTSSNISKTHFSQLEDLNQKINSQPILFKRSYAAYNDIENQMWLGTTNGLYTYKNNTLSPLFIDDKKTTCSVSCIDQTIDSSVWVTTSGNGLLEIKNSKIITNLTKDNLLLSNNCRSLVTSNALIYIGTDNGLVKYNTENKQTENLTINNGLPSGEINALAMDSVHLFIGTPKGLVVIKKDKIKQENIESPMFLTGISINGEDTLFNDNYDLSYKESTIDIRYNALEYKSRGNEKYVYRLIGLNADWLTTSGRSARFHSLNPGKYEFQVKMKKENGEMNSNVANVSFSIEQAWWKSTWFYTVAILSMMLFSGGVIYWRQKDLRKREMIENELDKRIQTLRIEALRTQMNPHFIYNALNAIQDFFVTYDEDAALIYLSKFAQLTRHIFENSSRELISLGEEIDFLELYLDLEKLRFGDKIKIDFQIDAALLNDIHEIEIPPLLIQPAIENAFKHGLMDKLEGGVLHIRFDYFTNHLIKCTIEDNGVGREYTARRKKPSTRDRKISGLEATRQRLKMWKPENRIKKKLLIIDLKSEDGKSNGTKIEIFI